MRIPDEKNQDEPKDVQQSVDKILVSDAYQNKVNKMLDDLPIGSRVRIGRVCKVESEPKFIQAVKNYIEQFDNDVLFSSDYKAFLKNEPWDEPVEKQTQTPMNREAVATRNSLIRWFRLRFKGEPIQPFTIIPAKYNDPKKFVDNMVLVVKNNKPESAPFKSAIHHLTNIKNYLLNENK
tara:strand:- start:1016 stop:1552 length:537 start_codon:yes stop_codon:yes gene_type:complete